jgi:hypothetical protein
MTIRYTAVIKDDAWHEVGDRDECAKYGAQHWIGTRGMTTAFEHARAHNRNEEKDCRKRSHNARGCQHEGDGPSSQNQPAYTRGKEHSDDDDRYQRNIAGEDE